MHVDISKNGESIMTRPQQVNMKVEGLNHCKVTANLPFGCLGNLECLGFPNPDLSTFSSQIHKKTASFPGK